MRNHISPLLGHLKAGQLDAEVLDSFYAELRRCRAHCAGRRQLDHRTCGPHECDHRCGPHRCRPLGPTTVRHMHFILSGAFKRAVRWRWGSVSPIGQAEPPASPRPNPEPPTPAETARIVREAWQDPAWGALPWVAMTTGAPRGELCAIRWSSVGLDPSRPVVWLRKAIREGDDGDLVEAGLKTHQQCGSPSTRKRSRFCASTAPDASRTPARWASSCRPMLSCSRRRRTAPSS